MPRNNEFSEKGGGVTPIRMNFVANFRASEKKRNIQGDPKKMQHEDSDLKSVLEVRFYFSTCVL